MRRTILQVVAVLACSAGLDADERTDFFETRIRPVLVQHCYACHSVEAARKNVLKGELRLDSKDAIRRGGSSGPAIIPGNSSESLLVSALRHESLEMPPSARLPDTIIADFVQWIDMGAADPRDPDSSGDLQHTRDADSPPHWAFQPPASPALPEVGRAGWVQNPIDRFVLAKLEAAGLRPAKRVDRRKLLRRASYDLIGLPPTPEQIDRFQRDTGPRAFRRAIGELLDSPHFGIHWARIWLDNVRYAQDDYTCCAFRTNEFDPTPYRDWLVRAFNSDLPYSDFVQLQIAGDLIAHSDPKKVNSDGITATGIWTFPHIIADNDLDKVVVDFVDQQIDVLGRTFLGLTLACARCHDHKFDPITQRDYYGLAGIFFSSHSLSRADPDTGNTSRIRAVYRVERPVFYTRQQVAEFKAQKREIQRLEAEMEGLRNQHRAAFDLRSVRRAIKNHRKRELKEGESEQDRRSTIARLQKQETKLLSENDPLFLKKKATVVYKQYDELDSQVTQLRLPLSKLKRRPAMLEGGSPGTRFDGPPQDVQLFVRGNHANLGARVPRAFPSILCWENEPPIGQRTRDSGRLQLAQWLTDPRHPLTARVMVNRIWKQLFGEGVVRTPSNFGRLGDTPSHPYLLDYLAGQFIRSGWSIKSTLREIMLSATYQQDSVVSRDAWQQDPDNRWFGRMNRKRLTAEQLRDTLSVFSAEVPRELHLDQFHESKRALFLQVSRIHQPDRLLSQFDLPDPSLVVPVRSDSTAPTQSLFMLNDPFVYQVAGTVAKRLYESQSDERDRLKHVYRALLGRVPTSAERSMSRDILRGFQQRWRQSTDREPVEAADTMKESGQRAWQELIHVLLCGNELLYVD